MLHVLGVDLMTQIPRDSWEREMMLPVVYIQSGHRLSIAVNGLFS